MTQTFTETHTHRCRVIVRPICDQDAAALAGAYTRLSEQSRWRRFLSVADELTQPELRRLTAVDYRDHDALVAVDPGSGEIVGSARYARIGGTPHTAELAVEVIDEWQRRGVGSALLDALTARARANDVQRFIAIVSSDNVPVRRALERAGATLCASGSEIEYQLDVDALERHISPPLNTNHSEDTNDRHQGSICGRQSIHGGRRR